MRGKVFVALVVAGALAGTLVLPSASADHGLCALGMLTQVEAGSDVWYLDDREASGLWVYRENGVASGFQAGGDILGVVVDPCGDGHRDVADDLIAHVPAA